MTKDEDEEVEKVEKEAGITKKREINFNKFIFIALVVAILIFGINGIYKNRNWTEKWDCSLFECYGGYYGNTLKLNDCNQTKNCQLENCTDVKNNLNTEIKECYCKTSNSKVQIICTNQVKVRGIIKK